MSCNLLNLKKCDVRIWHEWPSFNAMFQRLVQNQILFRCFWIFIKRVLMSNCAHWTRQWFLGYWYLCWRPLTLVKVVHLHVMLSWKSCIESTLVNSQNPSESLNILYFQECVKFTRLHFAWIWYSRKHRGK